jgi:integrase
VQQAPPAFDTSPNCPRRQLGIDHLAPAHERADELLAARGQTAIEHVTPHTLRRTFASLLAELGMQPRRAMYLLGHTNPMLTMRIYQQVLDVAEDTAAKLEEIMAGPLDEVVAALSGRGFWHRNGTQNDEGASNRRRLESW